MIFQKYKKFFTFICFSAFGWLSDFVTFTALVHIFDVNGFVANLMSSFVGVTFVWFSSLKIVFGSTHGSHQTSLFAFWAYQFFSILSYSALLQFLVRENNFRLDFILHQIDAEIAVKIFITPFNLVTNFLFIKWLIGLVSDTAGVSRDK
jgi:putative flippase GtrA